MIYFHTVAPLMFNTTYIYCFLQLYILGAVNSIFFSKGGPLAPLYPTYMYVYLYIHDKYTQYVNMNFYYECN